MYSARLSCCNFILHKRKNYTYRCVVIMVLYPPPSHIHTHTHTHTHTNIHVRTASEFRIVLLEHLAYNSCVDFSKNLEAAVGDTKQVPYCGPTNIRRQLVILSGPGDVWPGNCVLLA